MIGLIGGTGLGEALFGETHSREIEVETPFGKPSGPIRILEWHGLKIATLARHGRGHLLNPSQVPYRANIYALKSLGVTHILASGAVGSLREDIHPRQLVIVDQVIDKTFRRTPTFFDEGLAVHVEFAEPFCPALRRVLVAASHGMKTHVHPRGTYVCMEGPAFSTVAESNMHRAWGGDVIGMTAMPEAKLAREAEIAYALVALGTDYDCWKPHEPHATPQKLLDEIIGHLKAATANAIELLKLTIERLAAEGLPESPAHDALALAIWSDRALAMPGAARKYGVLLAKYAGKM
ncbi:MAG: S-methyl-5'-thioadenosine phosphorylase [Phycisphaerales bacterium]|nr:S-methyl-5'-thioadenosine phosphorylase [Phycisphaerales bacterium]